MVRAPPSGGKGPELVWLDRVGHWAGGGTVVVMVLHQPHTQLSFLLSPRNGTCEGSWGSKKEFLLLF